MTIRRSSRIVLAALAGCLAVAVAAAVPAAEANACRAAIRAAEVRYDLPKDLLLAIGLLESGLNPFALNLAGESRLPDNVAAAELLLVDADGNQRIDVTIGCMQLHARWHRAAFGNRPERMLDAAANVDYAARYLRRLHGEEGTWRRAVGRYNAGSVGGGAYQRYICLIDIKLRELDSDLRLGCDPA